MKTHPPPQPALILLGALYHEPEWLERAVLRLAPALGELRPAGEPMPFEWTDYYQKEMGSGLWRRFFSAASLLPRELLPDLKRLCVRIERELADARGHRRVNLDPGLLSGESLVLASTKGYAHRVYLRDGIWAEVTLRFVRGAFVAADWTYPDYASPEVQALLRTLREEYLDLLRRPHGVVAAAALAAHDPLCESGRPRSER
jgi:hypothetical protein